jgi:hypothetical protein
VDRSVEEVIGKVYILERDYRWLLDNNHNRK